MAHHCGSDGQYILSERQSTTWEVALMIGRLFAAACLLAAAIGGASAQAPKTATAIFAGGCFWCVEADFDKVSGVISTTSGYIGGGVEKQSYQQGSARGPRRPEGGGKTYEPAEERLD